MNCTAVDELLADAWGHELTGDRRAEFHAHLRECETCLRSFQEGAKALEAMHSLSGPKDATAWRRDDPSMLRLRAPSPGARSMRQPSHLLRLAASVMIAFTAGYGLHAGLMLRDATRGTQRERTSILTEAPPPGAVRVVPPNDTDTGLDGGDAVTLRTALTRAYARRGSNSHLATCLAAMSRPRR